MQLLEVLEPINQNKFKELNLKALVNLTGISTQRSSMGIEQTLEVFTDVLCQSFPKAQKPAIVWPWAGKGPAIPQGPPAHLS